MRHLICAAALVAVPHMSMATGMYTCEEIAQENWLTEAQLTEKLVADGWQVRRMKVDGGCWEVYGTMPDGTRVEGYFHPETGETLLLNQRGKILFRADS